MDIKGSKIIVIGGAGFIGSHVVEELIKEDVAEIVIFDNFCRGNMDNIREALRDPRVRVFELGGDILRTDILTEAVRGRDYVFHLAALWLRQCQEYPRSAFHVNIEGAFNVLEACARNQIKKLIYSSSASVYGDCAERPVTENQNFNSKSFYGVTKIAGEHMCRAFYHRFGLPYVGLRYMSVYGPRQDYMGVYGSVIMKILDSLEKGEAPEIFGDGSQSYDFLYVGDAARANVCALKAAVTDSFYNIGSGTQISVKALAERLMKITNRELPIRFNPVGEPFAVNRAGSTEKAEKELGFRALLGFDEGIHELIRWRTLHKERVDQNRLQGYGR